MYNVFNFVAFQVGWLACVAGGAYHYPWLGSSLTVVVVAAHLALVERPRAEAALLLAVGTAGWLWDSLLVGAGLLAFSSGTLLAGTAPHWIAAMWVLFASTLNHSLGWLRGRYITAAVLGAVGGPLAYLAGQRLGGVELLQPAPALATLGAGWALFMPLLTWAASATRRTSGIVAARPQ